MKSYQELVTADIYRDGGSLKAIFRLDDGTFESLWLSVLPWDSPADISYGDLRIRPDADGAVGGQLVSKGSKEEGEILDGLASFLQRPKINQSLSHAAEDELMLDYVRRMLDEIPKRTGHPSESEKG